MAKPAASEIASETMCRHAVAPYAERFSPAASAFDLGAFAALGGLDARLCAIFPGAAPRARATVRSRAFPRPVRQS